MTPRALDELTDSLSEADSGGRLKLATQKFYFAGLVACIENLCLSPHGVSSIERSARMRDMLEAPRTRQMVAALKDNHRGLGLLFGPIASAKPAHRDVSHLAASPTGRAQKPPKRLISKQICIELFRNVVLIHKSLQIALNSSITD